MLLLSLLLACAKPSAPTEVARPTGQLASFEAAWSTVSGVLPPGQMDEQAWRETYERLAGRARQARTAAELRPVLEEMLSSLGQSHYEVIPGDVLDVIGEAAQDGPLLGPIGDGDPGLDVRILDGQPVVVRLVEGGPADRAGVQLGDVLVSVGDAQTHALVAQMHEALDDSWSQGAFSRLAVMSTLMRRAGQTVEAVVERDGERKAVSIALGAGTLTGSPGPMAPQPITFEARVIDAAGYVYFDAFLLPVPQRFEAAVAEFKQAGTEALVLDLRGNSGGIVTMIRGLSGWFVGSSESLGTMVTLMAPMQLTVNPRPESQRLAGPVAVLVDEYSASTAEVYAAGLQGLGLARIFGATTAGRCLPSMIMTLPNGDQMQLATGHFTDPLDREIEGVGVVPDESVALSRASLARGEDPVLQAALRWIESQQEAP